MIMSITLDTSLLVISKLFREVARKDDRVDELREQLAFFLFLTILLLIRAILSNHIDCKRQETIV